MTPTELLVEALLESHPEDAARALEPLNVAEVAALVVELEPHHAAAVVLRMDLAFAASTLEQIDAREVAEILSGAPAAAAANLLRRFASAHRDAVLAACPAGIAGAVRAVLAHPARTAGALMDPQVPALPGDVTAGAACAVMRERPDRFKHYVYVVDRAGALVGVTRPIEIFSAAADAPLTTFMRSPVARIAVDDIEVAVLAHPGWARYRSMPVVDRDGRLVGVLRDDVVQSMQRARAAHGATPISFAVSLAELFWLGLTGVTEGVASVIGRETSQPLKASGDEVEP